MHVSEILEKATVSLLVRVSGTVLNFLFQVLLGRMLGAHGVGIYFLALSITTFMALIARLGMDHNLTRIVAAEAESQNWGRVITVVRQALWVCSGAAIFGSLLLIFGANWISHFVFSKPDLVNPLQVLAITVFPVALFILYARALQGLKRTGEAMLVETVIVPLVACIFVVWLVHRFEIIGGTIAYAIGSLVALFVATMTWRLYSRRWNAQRDEKPSNSMQALVMSSAPLLGVMLFQQLALVIPLFVLGAVKSGADVGLFYAANRTAALLGIIVVAANSIIAPKVAALHHAGEYQTLDRIIRTSAIIVTLTAAPALVVFLIIPDFVMKVFGAEFSAGDNLLRVLSVGQTINVLTGSVGLVLIMTNKFRSIFLTAMWTLIATVLLSLALIPTYGAAGAAWAVAGSLTVASVLRVVFAWRDLGILALPVPYSVFPAKRPRV